MLFGRTAVETETPRLLRNATEFQRQRDEQPLPVAK
jgi:hypothetical protein